MAWNIASAKAVKLVDVPLRIALWQRGRQGHPVVPGELTGHEDAGAQYMAIAFTEHLADEGIRPSIGSVADAYDNALMECVSGLYKTECIRSTISTPAPAAPSAVSTTPPPAGSIDATIGASARPLGMMTPVEFEQARYATFNRESPPV